MVKRRKTYFKDNIIDVAIGCRRVYLRVIEDEIPPENSELGKRIVKVEVDKSVKGYLNDSHNYELEPCYLTLKLVDGSDKYKWIFTAPETNYENVKSFIKMNHKMTRKTLISGFPDANIINLDKNTFYNKDSKNFMFMIEIDDLNINPDTYSNHKYPIHNVSYGDHVKQMILIKTIGKKLKYFQDRLIASQYF